MDKIEDILKSYDEKIEHLNKLLEEANTEVHKPPLEKTGEVQNIKCKICNENLKCKIDLKNHILEKKIQRFINARIVTSHL